MLLYVLSILDNRIQLNNCLVFIAVILSHSIVNAQEAKLIKPQNKSNKWHLSFQYIGLTYHPNGGIAPEIYPLKLDSRAYWVLEPGGAINADYYISNSYFCRLSAATYLDCAFVPAGYFHIGMRGTIIYKGKHQINGGMGPTFIYREDWHQFKEYKGDTFYGDRVYGNWQYRFILYGGEFEYLYKLNDKVQLQYSIIPGIPIVLTSKIGVRLKF